MNKNDSIGKVPLHVEMAADGKKNKTGKLKRRLPKQRPVFLRKYIIQNYVDRIKKEIVDRWKAATIKLVIDMLPDIQKKVEHDHPQGLRKDAWPDEMKNHIDLLEEQYDLIAEQSASIAAGTFDTVNGLSHRQWYGVAKQVLGVDLLKYEPWINNAAKSFVFNNVGLIKKAGTDTLHDINRIVMSGFQQGKRWETLKDEILGTNLQAGVFGNVEARAELIARDQTLKLYGNLNKQRQTNTGLVWYIWRTVEDERVRGNPAGKYPNARPSHYALDGKVCRWDNPTVYANSIKDAEAGNWKSRDSIQAVKLAPNEDYQCRCSGEAVFETLFMD